MLVFRSWGISKKGKGKSGPRYVPTDVPAQWPTVFGGVQWPKEKRRNPSTDVHGVKERSEDSVVCVYQVRESKGERGPKGKIVKGGGGD